MENRQSAFELDRYVSILRKHGCTGDDTYDLEQMWFQPWRVYHGMDHLILLLTLIEKYKAAHPGMSENEYESYVLLAFFHDGVYNPRENDNEERSAELYRRMCPDSPPHLFNKVYSGILDTKDHTKPASSQESEVFLQFDLHNLIYGSVADMIKDERKIFREFGFIDFPRYKENRAKLLKKFAPYIYSVFPNSKFNDYLFWCEHINAPRIAVYPGSFNPFHRGHLCILNKAEKMFDKVVVLIGSNPAKELSQSVEAKVKKLVETLPNNEVHAFEGMLHSHCRTLGYPVTIIKGLRNDDDFKSEKTQLRFMEDYDPEISVCYIISDRELEHVSSSAIRQINSIGPDTRNYLP